MASLLQQLVQQQPVLSEDVTSLYNQRSRKQTQPSLPEHIRLLQAHIQCFSRVFIVVDALDEYPEHDGVRELFLAQIRCLLPHISLLGLPDILLLWTEPLKMLSGWRSISMVKISGRIFRCLLKTKHWLKSQIKEDRKLKDTIISGSIDKANTM